MVSKSRLYIPALGQTYELLAPYAELLLRAGLGAIFSSRTVYRNFLGGSAARGLSGPRNCSRSSAIRRPYS